MEWNMKQSENDESWKHVGCGRISSLSLMIICFKVFVEQQQQVISYNKITNILSYSEKKNKENLIWHSNKPIAHFLLQ